MNPKTLSVSQLNNYIKKIIDNDFILRNSYVKGEISNLKFHSSGHIYFSLKDGYSKINCIMFKTYAEEMTFIPQDGDNVILKGRVLVYQKEGTYQFYCEEIEKDGIGDLYLEFERLKNKLQKEGLFEESHKKQIPKYVRKIGVITSPTGAAIRDIINVTKRRNSAVDILIYPSLVQGDSAIPQLIRGVNYLDNRKDVDLIIIARGGGSLEELWAFNDENLARAIYNCNKPIISGVGHETDFTICDFVSDKRAPTPSAAAEIAVFNVYELKEKVDKYKKELFTIMNKNLIIKHNNLDNLKNRLKLNSPTIYIVNERVRVDSIKSSLLHRVNAKLEYEKANLIKLNSLLSAYNPLNVLNKGYSVIQNENDSLITEADQLMNSEFLKITLKKGKIKAYLKDAQELK